MANISAICMCVSYILRVKWRNWYWYHFLGATKLGPSVRLSVGLSVTPFLLCPSHRIIMKFSEVITTNRSDVHAKGQGQRSNVRVTEVITPLSRFWTATPVWSHIWQWNDAQSLIMLRRIPYSGPDCAFPDCNSSLNSLMATKWCTKLEVA